ADCGMSAWRKRLASTGTDVVMAEQKSLVIMNQAKPDPIQPAPAAQEILGGICRRIEENLGIPLQTECVQCEFVTASGEGTCDRPVNSPLARFDVNPD